MKADVRQLEAAIEVGIALDKQMEAMLERNQRMLKYLRNQLTLAQAKSDGPQPQWPVQDSDRDFDSVPTPEEFEREVLKALDSVGLRYVVDKTGQHYRVWVAYRFEPIKEGALK